MIPLLAGYVARFISQKLPMPVSIESLKPILIIPLFASLVTGLGMIYVIGSLVIGFGYAMIKTGKAEVETTS